MNVRYRFTLTLTLLSLVLFSFTAESLSAAEDRYSCTVFQTLYDQLSIRFALMEDKLTLKRSIVEERMQNRSTVEMPQRSQRRDKVDSLLQNHYAQLRNLANTQTQRIAVEEYMSLLNRAYSQYRDIIDANTVAAQYLDQHTLRYYRITHEALMAYKKSVLRAVQEGYNECGDGTAPGMLRTTLKERIHRARAAYDADVAEAAQLRENILESASLIQASNREARRQLQTDIEQALRKLTSILGVQIDTPEQD